VNEEKDVVYLIDCNSKFGTSVNGVKLPASEKMCIKEGDVIKFGAQTSEFKFYSKKKNFF